MNRLNKRIRKEKKIFDPSCGSPTDKKRKKNSISIISTNLSLMDNKTKFKLKELYIKLKRLQPEDIGKYLEQQSSDLSQVKIEAADVSVKEEPIEEATVVSVDELLSDQESEEETSQAKVFECPYAPKCTGERSSLNRLRLHILSGHEQRDLSMRCPICDRRTVGWKYEMHVIQEHALLLEKEEEDSYLFSPQVSDDVSSQVSSVLPVSLPRPGTPPHTISFSDENPWQEILSPATRQKRSMDAVSVSSILRKTELEPYSNQGETSHTKKAFYHNMKEFASVQNKVNFLCSLDINSHYKQYLEQLKHLKLKKRLLTKYISILNDPQIEKLKGEIKICEGLLNQYATGETRKTVFEMLATTTAEKKKQELLDNENKIIKNLRKKGIIKTGNSVLPERKVVAINRKTGEISKIIPKNIISLMEKQRSKSKISEGENQIIWNLRKKGIIQAGGGMDSLSATPTVIDQKDPLSFEDDEEEEKVRREDKSIPSQSLYPGSVIALNIPVEEIIETNHVVDIKSEI